MPSRRQSPGLPFGFVVERAGDGQVRETRRLHFLPLHAHPRGAWGMQPHDLHNPRRGRAWIVRVATQTGFAACDPHSRVRVFGEREPYQILGGVGVARLRLLVDVNEVADRLVVDLLRRGRSRC